MKAKSVIVDGSEYVLKESEGSIKIVVLDRGFIYVGNTEIQGDFVKITNARNIRAWGTTKGLGELVNGPLPSTKLDTVGTVCAPLRALISLISVEDSKWNTF